MSSATLRNVLTSSSVHPTKCTTLTSLNVGAASLTACSAIDSTSLLFLLPRKMPKLIRQNAIDVAPTESAQRRA